MPAEQKRPDVVEARKTWHRRVAHKKLGRPIVLDETAFTTNRHTACGYAPKGERLTVFEPHGYRNTTTFAGALTLEGLIAPLVIDGPINSLTFESYITNTLAQEVRSGDLLIMDNLSAHKAAEVQQALNRAGIKYLYLPPYSPNFSPIENAFSKIKRRMRELAEKTFSGLWRALGTVLQSISRSKAAN
jgi:transposase